MAKKLYVGNLTYETTDGDLQIRAPCDDCTIFMPARTAIVGREGVYLTRPLN